MQSEDYLSPDNIAAYLSFTNSTEEAIRSGTPVIYDPDMVIPADGLADVERVHRENGRTDYAAPIDLAKVVDDQLTKQAVEILGAYQK
jgi:NitT/TauT family transport system substrate-binding protein